MSKKTNKKNEEVPVKEDVVEEAIDNIEKAVVDVEALTRNALQLQQTAQNLANQLQQYMQLTKHYEKTINILTGRLEEQERLVQQLSANAQKEAL